MSDVPSLPMPSEGYGDKSLVPIPPSQPTDLESVQIQSMDVLAEVVEAAAEVVEDISLITIEDVEKIIKSSVLTKKDITEAIREALVQPVSQVKDSSILIRSQLKLDDIHKKASPTNASDKPVQGTKDLSKIFGSGSDWLSGKDKGKDKERASFSEMYHKLLNVASVATSNPLKLIDMSADWMVGKIDKLFGKKGSSEDKKGDKLFDNRVFSRSSPQSPGGWFSEDVGRRPVQTATMQSGGFESIFGPNAGLGDRDPQTVTVQDVSPIASFVPPAPPLLENKVNEEGVVRPLLPAPAVQEEEPVMPLLPAPAKPAEEVSFSSMLAGLSSTKDSLGSGMGDRPGGAQPVLGEQGVMSKSGLVPAPEKSEEGFNEVEAKSPGVGGFLSNPFASIFGSGKKSTSSEDNVQAEVAESDLKANKMMFKTFDEPEKSHFGKFLDNQITEGGSGGKGKEKSKGLLDAFLPVLIGAGVLFFLPKIIEFLPKMLSFVNDTLIPKVLVPLGNFVTGTLIPKVIAPLFGFIMDTLIPKVIIPIGKWALGKLKDFIEWVKDFLWPQVIKPVMAWAKDTLFPIVKTIGGIVWDTVIQFFGSIAELATGKITLLDFLFGEKSLLSLLASNTTEALGMKEGSASEVLTSNAIKWGAPAAAIGSAVGPVLFPVLGPLAPLAGALLFGLGATGVSSAIEGISNALTNYFGGDSAEANPFTREVSEKDALRMGVSQSNMRPGIEKIELVRRRFAAEEAYIEEHGSADGFDPLSVDDAIITSDGQVIHTNPDDNIYAFKGDVSIAPANQVREYPGFPSGGPFQQNNNSSTNNSNVVNNFISQVSAQLADMLPYSEFEPVGV